MSWGVLHGVRDQRGQGLAGSGRDRPGPRSHRSARPRPPARDCGRAGRRPASRTVPRSSGRSSSAALSVSAVRSSRSSTIRPIRVASALIRPTASATCSPDASSRRRTARSSRAGWPGRRAQLAAGVRDEAAQFLLPAVLRMRGLHLHRGTPARAVTPARGGQAADRTQPEPVHPVRDQSRRPRRRRASPRAQQPAEGRLDPSSSSAGPPRRSGRRRVAPDQRRTRLRRRPRPPGSPARLSRSLRRAAPAPVPDRVRARAVTRAPSAYSTPM